MNTKRKILGINGSASRNSSNLAILHTVAELGQTEFDLKILADLTTLPHFKTELTQIDVPETIVGFRKAIADADGIIICTPEYVFSIPSGLKNAIEWCVSTTVFSGKPVGLITASASGEKAHEELKLIMQTVQTNFIEETTLLIQGVKGKVNNNGQIIDCTTENELKKFIQSFNKLMENAASHTVYSK